MDGRVYSCVFYAFVGLVIVFLNKTVLTTYKFPGFSIMGALQAITMVTVLRTARHFGWVSFPDISMAVIKQVFPLPPLYLINLLASLNATKRLNLPMYVVLRRFGILTTLMLQTHLLDMRPSTKATVTVLVIVFGSIFAAIEDLSFDSVGYLCILLYDFVDSFEVVLMKKQLSDRKSLGRVGIIYYCALFSVGPLCLYVWLTGDFHEAFYDFKGWSDVRFVCLFFSCSIVSAVFVYSFVLCTDYNNPVLSQVIACIRSLLTTYIGMFIGGDYIFNIYNFIALNMSMAAAFYYTYISFKEPAKEEELLPKKELESLDV